MEADGVHKVFHQEEIPAAVSGAILFLGSFAVALREILRKIGQVAPLGVVYIFIQRVQPDDIPPVAFAGAFKGAASALQLVARHIVRPR